VERPYCVGLSQLKAERPFIIGREPRLTDEFARRRNAIAVLDRGFVVLAGVRCDFGLEVFNRDERPGECQ
jgi:hypothetical protein